MAVRTGVGPDLRYLFRGDAGLVLATVMKPALPKEGPHQAGSGENAEHGAPTQCAQQRNHEERRERSAQPAGGPDHALSTSALRLREPAANHSGRVWIGAGLSRAKEKLGDHELDETEGGRGCGSKDAPAHHHPRQNLALPDTVSGSA